MEKLKDKIRKRIPTAIWSILVKAKGGLIHSYIAVCDWYLIKKAPKRHRKALEDLRTKKKIKVAFFLTHESVWKYDVLYNLMLQHSKFEPQLFVCPVMNYGKDNMLFEMNKTFESFKRRGYDVIRTYDIETEKYLNIKKIFTPDIVFFTNPYEGLQDDRYYIKEFGNTLTCYVPYAIMMVNYKFIYNLSFHNLVWRIFSESPIHKEIASKIQKIKGDNMIVTGYPGLDPLLINKNPIDVWKNNNRELKRIVWAPHHSMTDFNKVANFLEYYDFFLELAIVYKDKLQIAFKPHHLLRVKLESDSYWGKEKTDLYFNKWINLENGQFENSDYVDLFLTSDALIHDCGSFMAEYLITGKPSLFMVRNESIMEYWNAYGEQALAVHYQSRNQKQLIYFIENVVLQEDDWMKEERNFFVEKKLLPKNKLTASENILHHLESQIFE